MHSGQIIDILISWWPVFRLIFSTIGWFVILVQLARFVLQRKKSYTSLVHTNTLLFNQMQSAKLNQQIEVAVKQARCSKCGQCVDRAFEQDEPLDESLKHSVNVVEARNDFPVRKIPNSDGSSEHLQIDKHHVIFHVSRAKNSVSKLTRKFESVGISPKYNIHKSIPTILPRSYFANDDQRSSESPSANRADPAQSTPWMINQIHSQNQISAEPSDESSCSSSPEIHYRKTVQKSGNSPQRNSMENILERDDEWGNSCDNELVFLERSHSASDVRCVEDILQQERFSKCFSEYSISDLLNDFPSSDAEETTEDEVDLSLFLNRME